MENFNWTCFNKKIVINSTIDKLYDAWTIPEEIEKWFLRKAIFEKLDGSIVGEKENIKPRYKYKWSWFLFEITEEGEIIEANGKDLLKFTFAGDCLVEVKLTQFEENVIVELTQSNIPTDDHSKRGIRLGCESGWSFFLVNLKSIYEGGVDLRNKNENIKGMLNN